MQTGSQIKAEAQVQACIHTNTRRHRHAGRQNVILADMCKMQACCGTRQKLVITADFAKSRCRGVYVYVDSKSDSKRYR